MASGAYDMGFGDISALIEFNASQTGAPLLLVAKAEPLDLVAAERHDQRALVAIVDGCAGLGFERRAEFQPLPLAVERKRQQVVAARLVFGRGGEHAGRGEARAAARLRAVEHRDRQAAAHQPPGDRQADHAGADHRHVHLRRKYRRRTGAIGAQLGRRLQPRAERDRPVRI